MTGQGKDHHTYMISGQNGKSPADNMCTVIDVMRSRTKVTEREREKLKRTKRRMYMIFVSEDHNNTHFSNVRLFLSKKGTTMSK
jgi:hypothetical protein